MTYIRMMSQTMSQPITDSTASCSELLDKLLHSVLPLQPDGNQRPKDCSELVDKLLADSSSFMDGLHEVVGYDLHPVVR